MHSRKLSITVFAVLLALAAFVAGCGGKNSGTELELLCGSSFTEPMAALTKAFTEETGIAIVTSTAGSEDFLPQVKTAGRGDILTTHDPYLDYVKDADAYLDHAQVGHLAPVLAVRKGNPKGVASIEDLAKPGLEVALTDPKYSTCGEMVFALLEKKGIKEAVLANVENRLTKGHSKIGTFLKTEAVDAAILWNGVANNFKDALEVVPTPYEYDSQIAVHVIGLGYSKRAEAVKRFIAFAKAHGPEIFASYGYVKSMVR